jgi:hypothetical protein
MPHTIEITGATGTPPYSVYVCDSTFTYCYVVTGSTMIPPTFIFDVPSPLDVASSVIVKIVDANGCETFEPYSCPPTPTPTPTITPTPSSTPTDLCYCITITNTGSTIGSFDYTDCNGNVVLNSPADVGITLFVCGSNPTNLSEVTSSVGILCVSGSCPDSEIVPTPTPTPTPSFIPSYKIFQMGNKFIFMSGNNYIFQNQ